MGYKKKSFYDDITHSETLLHQKTCKKKEKRWHKIFVARKFSLRLSNVKAWWSDHWHLKNQRPLNLQASSYEYLNTKKITFLFNELLKKCGSLYSATLSMKSVFHTSASFGTTWDKFIESIFESFSKDILLSNISLPHC